MIFNINEFINELVLIGYSREEAIDMAKDEMAKRKTVIKSNKQNNNKSKKPLILGNFR